MLRASRGRRNWSRWVMCGQGADLDEVVGEYSVAAPYSRPGEGFTQCVPSVAAFEVVYTVITLVRQLILARKAFRCSNSRRVALGFTGARDRDGLPEFVQFGVHCRVPVSVIRVKSRDVVYGVVV